MGNAICCASTVEDTVATAGELRRPALFGKVHVDSDDSGSDEHEHPLEERLRDLVPKIRQIKSQLEICQKQQIRLKEEVLTHKDGNTVSETRSA
mgnify:CR=1 FL=1